MADNHTTASPQTIAAIRALDVVNESRELLTSFSVILTGLARLAEEDGSDNLCTTLQNLADQAEEKAYALAEARDTLAEAVSS